jgi:succinate-semialdehyde dehydrogenase/glutarate-semialdehyde dehydrogenase
MSEFKTVNPATGAILKTYSHLEWAKVDALLTKAHEAYLQAKTKSLSARIMNLRALGSALRSRKEEIARMMTLEMGKAIKDSLGEVEKCAVSFDYFADHLEVFLKPEWVKSSYARSEIVKDSIGPILAVMPWNFPLWQVTRFAAPAVGIGNPILLKHADLTAGTAELITEIFDRVAPGLLFNLRIDHELAARVVADKRCAAVTLTGSARAGREVAAVAGRSLKKTVLELGGSDAYVVLSDADVEKSAKICANGRMTNNGQSCVAAKRFIVHQSVLSRFLISFEKQVRALPFGDPLLPATFNGSLASKKFQTDLLKQCSALENVGGKKVFDLGESYDFSAPGAYFPARAYMIDANVDFTFTEEFFGPVALVTSFKTEAEALEIANKSIYGLGGAVFSQDLERAEAFARLMETGFVGINDQVKSDPHLPFGGVKNSGYGRELSRFGFDEFCNIKTIGFGS